MLCQLCFEFHSSSLILVHCLSLYSLVILIHYNNTRYTHSLYSLIILTHYTNTHYTNTHYTNTHYTNTHYTLIIIL